MRDASYIVAIFAILFLVVAGVAGFRILRKPDQEPPTKKNLRRSNSAAMVIVIAFLLAVLAAVLAFFGLF